MHKQKGFKVRMLKMDGEFEDLEVELSGKTYQVRLGSVKDIP